MSASRDISRPCVALAAGGTGGHVFPAEALARELLERGLRPVLVTDRRGGAYGGALAEIEVRTVRSGAMAGRGALARLAAIVELGVGTAQAFGVLRGLRPVAVVGFGGYPSVPTMFAAARMGIPTLIHEQNAVLGRANRFLARRVDRIATSLDLVGGPPAGLADKVVATGMPARPAVIAARATPWPALDADGPARILVLGGSQGAHVFAEVVPQAVARLPETPRRRLRIAQHCRAEDLEAVRAAYAAIGVEAELSTFFTDVPARLAAAHLLIARAGASTVAEATVIGRPAILVPYPFAADDHQSANARAVDAAGAGWMMPQDSFTPESLATRLDALFAMPGILETAAACARAFGRADAAARLADAVLGLTQAKDTEWNATGRERGRS